MSTAEAFPHSQPGARERILDTAYQLFSRRAVRDVGVDEVIEQAGVAKATLYRHFPSKDDLVIAFLELREERWTLEWVEAEARRRGSTPEERLLVIFELFDEWFQRDDFEAALSSTCCSRWVPHIPPARRASGISRASERSWLVSQRRPNCVTRSPSRTRGTSS